MTWVRRGLWSDAGWSGEPRRPDCNASSASGVMTQKSRSAGGLPADRLGHPAPGEALGRGPRTVLLGRMTTSINLHVDNLHAREGARPRAVALRG